MVEIALGLVIGRLRLQIGRELFERQIGIAEQLVQRGAELLFPKLELQLRGEESCPGVVEVELRAGLAGRKRALAVDIAAPEIDRLLAKLDELAQRVVIAFEGGKLGVDGVDPALRLLQGE